MADLPQYDYNIKDEKKESKTKEIVKLTDMNAAQVAELVKKLNKN